jgi:hypothetical protein
MAQGTDLPLSATPRGAAVRGRKAAALGRVLVGIVDDDSCLLGMVSAGGG